VLVGASVKKQNLILANIFRMDKKKIVVGRGQKIVKGREV